MLHLVADDNLTQGVVERIAVGDDVLLQAGSAWATYLGHRDNNKIVHLLGQQCSICVLSDVIAANGMQIDRLLPGVKVIDYPAFVDLTVDNSVIHTWC